MINDKIFSKKEKDEVGRILDMKENFTYPVKLFRYPHIRLKNGKGKLMTSINIILKKNFHKTEKNNYCNMVILNKYHFKKLDIKFRQMNLNNLHLLKINIFKKTG